MTDTDRALFSTEVFLQERFPLSLIHQASNRVVEEGSVGQNLVLFIGQSHGQIGFLSGGWRRADRKQEPERNVRMTLQHLLTFYKKMLEEYLKYIIITTMIIHTARIHSGE